VVQIDNSDLKRVVQGFRSESVSYYRQFVIWLGLGSAGAETAFISLAIKLPDPNYTMRTLLLSLWAFFVGMLAAALSALFASFSSSWAGEHFAEANNREGFKEAANKMPEMFSSPQRIADEANQERNRIIDRANKSHQTAEHAWQRHLFWKRARNVTIAISAIAFLVGMAWPIGYVTFGGRLFP
jgi:hypothetical protein